MPFERERRHTAQVVSDILNCSDWEARLPQSWKEADIAPVPKQTPADDVLETNITYSCPFQVN